MSDVGRGIPLLSGPPPPTNSSHAEIACRKCNKEFNMIFARARKCNHCGYSYCHSCSDYQALMPRTGSDTGYDSMHVCAFCVEFLAITAAGRQQLKAMSLAKLKKYLNAYNIKTDRAVEKDDLIDAILSAKGPNGCLPHSSENFYRTYSVPNKVPPGRPRGLFTPRPNVPTPTQSPPNPPASGPRPEFARPDLAPDHPPPQSYPQSNIYPPRPQPPPPQPQQQHYNPPPGPPPRPHSAYGSAPPPNPPPQFHAPRPTQSSNYNGYPGQGARSQAPPPAPPHHTRPHPQSAPQHQADWYNSPPRPPPPQQYHPQQRPAPQHAPPPPTAPRPRAVSTPPPPSLDQLLNMSQAAIGSLSIGALKSILFTNHVNAGQILEKSELVKKVLTLVEVEKSDRERQRQAEQREEMERVQREMEREAEREREREAREAASAHRDTGTPGQDGAGPHYDDGHPQPTSTASTPPKPAPAPLKAQASTSALERTGLCVICQDEEANIAIVDCGHMVMCRGCSDLVMGNSRECPLCRTRIVTEARLLRIFKT